MTRIADLGEKNKNLPSLIAEYDAAFADIEANLRVKGKTLQQALSEQATWAAYYDSRRAELKALVKHMEAQVASVRGRLYKQYTENYSRQLSERALSNYVDNEAEYINIHTLLLEVEELYDKYSAAVEAFTKRGFALRDITNARIHAIQDVTL